MSYFQELLDFVEERGGNVESARKAVFDSAAALSISTEGVASAILVCMRSAERGDVAEVKREGKRE